VTVKIPIIADAAAKILGPELSVADIALFAAVHGV
jgi:hypothetical protein